MGQANGTFQFEVGIIYAMRSMAEGKSQQAISEELINQGIPSDFAMTIAE